MHIIEIKIKNFRGLTTKIDNLKKRFLIIGKNDTGKTSFCRAIRKVLDYKTRKIPLIESDSTDSNKEEIFIKIVFDLEDISSNNRAILGEYIDKDDNGSETLTVKLIANFNEHTQSYDENIIFGSLDLSTPKSASHGNDLDKILDFIYVHPNYNLERDTKNYLNYHKTENNKNNIAISQNILSDITRLNNSISIEPIIKNMKNELNDTNSMKNLFEDITFRIESNFELSNIYKSLKIQPLNKGKIINIGDGSSKALSLFLQKLINNKDKEKIIVLEEPENHLFPLLQKKYASLIDEFYFGQTIITTHSPNVIDLRKTDEILKFNMITKESIREFNLYRTNIDNEIYKKFGYSLNEEITKSFFYDEVLLIEGYSEKLFYNILINQNKEFRNVISRKSIGFVCVYGVDFFPSKKILESLGTKVHILTDNDFIKIPRSENKKRYSGIQRSLQLLSEKEKEKLNELMKTQISKDMFSVIDNSNEHNNLKIILPKIIMELRKFNIYVNEVGFENSFLDFIGVKGDQKSEDLKYLNKNKMKNLHKYIVENNIDINVSNTNKENLLVSFIYEK